MKKQEVKNVENLNAVVNGEIIKSAKPRKKITSMDILTPTRKETRARFISYICSSEQISINKFFKLFNTFKAEDPEGYKEYISARKMDLNIDYTFEWFKNNCPTIEGNFAKWVKVTEKVKANEKTEYNRLTAGGVKYTLVSYNCYRANWEQYETILNDVVKEVRRIAKENAEKAAAEKREKQKAAAKLSEIEKLKAKLQALEAA